MYFVGIDIGSAATKAAAVDLQGEVLSTAVIPMGTGTRGSTAALDALYQAGGLDPAQRGGIIATGYGRLNFKGADTQLSEIICHAKGVKKVLPTVHTIIDIGGQDSKAIRVSDKGTIEQFVMNDKCAAGTGRFLEVMCKVLDLGIDEMGPVSLTAKEALDISNTCTVFAESEVIALLSRGTAKEDIIAGVHFSVAAKACALAQRVGARREVVLCGGAAKNGGVADAIEKELGAPLAVAQNPQLTGALGAALLAYEEQMRKEKSASPSGWGNTRCPSCRERTPRHTNSPATRQ